MLLTLAMDFLVALWLNREDNLEKCLSFLYPFQLMTIVQTWMTQASIRLNKKKIISETEPVEKLCPFLNLMHKGLDRNLKMQSELLEMSWI